MAKRLTYSFDFPYPTETVFQQGITTEYLEAKAPFLEHQEPELLDLHDGPDGGGASARYKIETDLPGWAKKMFPARNTVTETHTWPGRAGDGGRSYSFVVKIANVPVDINGHTEITPVGESACRADTSIDIKAGLPLVGGKLEDLVARDLGRTVEGEAAFMRKWMENR